jgi:hypothetical protein
MGMTPAGRGVLADGEFRGLWAAFALSLAGDQLAQVALAVLVFQATGSAVATAAAYAVSLLPWLVGGPLLSGLWVTGTRGAPSWSVATWPPRFWSR